ncbi:MAG: hypothetical protein R2794_04500 [Chitinophagales bacterium]
MHRGNIALITEDRYIHPLPGNTYTDNILLEDTLITNALEKYSFKTERVSWSDPAYDWQGATLAIFRTTWDYFENIDRFRQWLRATEKQTTFINHPDTIRWNLDKHYLHDLQARSIPIVETVYIEQGDVRSLEEIIRSLPFTRCIVKPCIAGAARLTFLTDTLSCAALNENFARWNAEEAFMIQPFYSSVLTEGECTYVVMNGTFTHAVRKTAKQGDFRVQDDFGGMVHNYTPSTGEIKMAEMVMRSIDPLPVYGRVDVLRNEKGVLCVSELELIEPELWLRFHPPAAEQFAQAIAEQFH